MKILITFAITGETAEDYMDVHPDLIFEDFVFRHNQSSNLESVSVTKEEV